MRWHPAKPAGTSVATLSGSQGSLPRGFSGDLASVNVARLALLGGGLRVQIALPLLTRIMEVLGTRRQENAQLTAALAFHRDGEQRLRVEGRCRTTLALTCNRCLEDLEQSIDSAFVLHLMPAEEAEALDEETRHAMDIAEVDPSAVDVLALLEDELLLALPEKLCAQEPCPRSPPFSFGPADVDELAAEVAMPIDGDRQRPFLGLRTLLEGGKEREKDAE